MTVRLSRSDDASDVVVGAGDAAAVARSGRVM